MLLLDLDPNVVKPGWTALIITILLAFALVLLYLSMRRQFRKINIPGDETDVEPSDVEPVDGEPAEGEPAEGEPAEGDAPTPSDSPSAKT